MKKFISWMLIVVIMAAMAMSLMGCGKEQEEEKVNKLVVYGLQGGVDPEKKSC